MHEVLLSNEFGCCDRWYSPLALGENVSFVTRNA